MFGTRPSVYLVHQEDVLFYFYLNYKKENNTIIYRIFI